MNAKTPQNVQEIQSFMGLVNFYGRFSKNIATLAYPLHKLTRKGVQWHWDKECSEAFINIKKEICSDRVLVHYDPNLPVFLSTDASPVGLGAVLSHKFADGSEHPIAFASRTLTPTEQRYSQIDKEALGIVWGIKKFYLYLKGRRFTLVTDHKPLVAIFSCKKGLPVLSATRLLHYALFLQAYQFNIVYRNTADHGNADFLSRLPMKSEDLDLRDEISMFQMCQIETLPITHRDLARESKRDEDLKPIYHALKTGEHLKGKGDEAAQYAIENDCILRGSRVCIPKCYQRRVLQDLHTGHLGMMKMKALARSYVYWKNIDKDIEEVVRSCAACEKHKADPPKVKTHYWEYPNAPWERIHVDFAGPIFEHMLFIVVDAYSKWLEVFPMKKITSTKTIECLRECFSRYGLPITLVSDNGPQLKSEEFENFLTRNGIIHKTCAPYKPSSNGQAERYVYTVKQSLRAMSDLPGSLQEKLNIFLMQYRKAPNMTTQQSPSFMFMKREIRTVIDLLRPDLRLQIDQRRNKDIYFRDRFFRIGDRVAVRNYRQGDSKWKFGTVISRDGQLHYTIDVNGQLWRRHIDQIRNTAVSESETTPSWVPRYKLPEQSTDRYNSVQSESTRESSASRTERDSDDPHSSCTLPDTPVETPAPISPARKELQRPAPVANPVPAVEPTPGLRRSTRIRKPPKRLNL